MIVPETGDIMKKRIWNSGLRLAGKGKLHLEAGPVNLNKEI